MKTLNEILRKRFPLSPFDTVPIRWHGINFVAFRFQLMWFETKRLHNRKLRCFRVVQTTTGKHFVPAVVYLGSVKVSPKQRRLMAFANQQIGFASACLRIFDELIKREPDWLKCKQDILNVPEKKEYPVSYDVRDEVTTFLDSVRNDDYIHLPYGFSLRQVFK